MNEKMKQWAHDNRKQIFLLLAHGVLSYFLGYTGGYAASKHLK